MTFPTMASVARAQLALLAPVLALSMTVAGCESDDVGKACGTDANTPPPDPIAGEEPVLEVVRMERDGTCETFQCLRHAGISPYCTRECEFENVGTRKSCTSDDDCTAPRYCSDGECRDDDCPNGFWCRQVQETGPIAGQQFCVRRDSCEQNLDCEKIGELICVPRGCYDVCLTEGRTCETDEDCPGSSSMFCDDDICRCRYHELVCEVEDELPCRCPGGEQSTDLDCADEDLECAELTQTEQWAEGSVTRKGICEHKDPL